MSDPSRQRRAYRRALWKRIPKPVRRGLLLEHRAGVTVDYVRERGEKIRQAEQERRTARAERRAAA